MICSPASQLCPGQTPDWEGLGPCDLEWGHLGRCIKNPWNPRCLRHLAHAKATHSSLLQVSAPLVWR